MARAWLSRWELLQRCGLGLGSMALDHLLSADLLRAAPPNDRAFNDFRPRPGHFAARRRTDARCGRSRGCWKT
jgi:hypothetical protein